MLIDSHCHLDFEQYDDTSVEQLLLNAKEQGVTKFITIGCDLQRAEKALNQALRFNEIYACIGIHPNDVYDLPEDYLAQLRSLFAKSDKVIGVGEIGLDYFREHDKTMQQKRVVEQLDLASELNKPVCLHMRGEGAYEDMLGILKKRALGPRSESGTTLRGIAHCFVSTYEHALEFIELGFLLSFNGIVTFSNAKDIQELATKIPLENIVLETDAPFLAPTPFRGKRNEPAYVRYVAEKIAELKGVSYEEVCEVTSRNVEEVFGKLLLIH